MDDDDKTPTEPLDRSLLRAAQPANDDDVTKRECPRCEGRGAKMVLVGGQEQFERGDCTLCKGNCMVTSAEARAWELHREMVDITKGPR